MYLVVSPKWALCAVLLACGPAGAVQEVIPECPAATSAEAQYQQALEAGKGGDAVRATTLLACAATAGHAAAQWAFGTMLVERGSDEGSRAAGAEWQRRAAAQGHLPALLQEGVRAADAGQGQAALDWFRKAADTGDAASQHGLALMLRDGELGDPDLAAAARWFRAAAEQGHPGAQSALARAYIRGEGVHRDVYAGQFWLQVLSDAAGADDRRARDAMAAATHADDLAWLRAHASTWRPGTPGMPYASGQLAYKPIPEDLDRPALPYATWTLRDAAAVSTPDGWLLLLSPYPLVDVSLDASGLGFPTGLLLTISTNGSLASVLLHDERGYIELDPAAFVVRLTPGTAILRGALANAEGSDIEVAGAWIEVQFAAPVSAAETGD